jgi:RimJ/RimL family protein N-acetyltransferase
MAAYLRRVQADDFEAFDKFARFDDAFAYCCIPKGNYSATESWRHFCEVIGHWELRGYGWYGLFDSDSHKLLGSIGAQYSPFLRNVEFALVSRYLPGQHRHTWQMAYEYVLTEDWRKFETDTYARVDSENIACKAFLRRFGCRYIKEFKDAKGSTTEIWKVDWPSVVERYQNSNIRYSRAA